MPRPAASVPECDMSARCRMAWVQYTARDRKTHRLIEIKRSCRAHLSVCVAHMVSIPNVRIEVEVCR